MRHSTAPRGLNKTLTEALSLDPDILLVDEPTNHRRSLMRMLNSFSRTLIIVSHDIELLNKCIDILWHIDQRKIYIFHGKYENYMHKKFTAYKSIEKELMFLGQQEKEAHHSLMKEQTRAGKSKAKGEKVSPKKVGWPSCQH